MSSTLQMFGLSVLVVTFSHPLVLEASDALPKEIKEIQLGPSVDLIKLIEVERDTKYGTPWTKTGGSLISSGNVVTSLRVPYKFPDDYLIHAKTRRINESNTLAITLKVEDSYTHIYFNGWYGKLSGLHMLDGREARDGKNETRSNSMLIGEKSTDLMIAVRGNKIQVFLDGNKKLDWEGDTKRLSMHPYARCKEDEHLWLATMKANWEFSSLTIAPIIGGSNTPTNELALRHRTAASVFAQQWSIEQELDIVAGQSNRSRYLHNPHNKAFYLDLHDPPLNRHRVITGSLLREIGRQSLLLTARDEFGLLTRDLALRDQFPWGAKEVKDVSPQDEGILSIYSLVNHENQALMTIFASPRTEPLWHSEFTVDSNAPYTSFVSRAEEFSRGPFIEFLKKRKQQPLPLKWTDAGVPANTLSAEQDFDVFTQYENIRNLHRVIRESGESTARLTCLARSYVHLGELTSTYLSPMSNAFNARALLYAERAIARSRNASEALWSRAYVRAWCGFPASALEDMEAAKLKAGVNNPPDWSTDLELYCRGNHRELEERILKNEGTKIAYMLYWFSQKPDSNKENVFNSLATAAAQYDDCLHLLFAATMLDSLGAKATIRRTLPEIPALLKRKLSKIQGLPTSVSRLIHRPGELTYEQIESIISDLLATEKTNKGPSAEISQALLGQIISEIMMRSSWSIVRYERNSLGIPIDERMKAMKPLVSNHPYGPAIESLAVSDIEGWDKKRDWFRSIDAQMIEPATFDFIKFFSHVNPVVSKSIHQAYAIRHLDESANDLVRKIEREESPENRLFFLSRMKTVAPDFPKTIEFRLKLERDACTDLLPEWEQRFQQSPGLLKEIATAYLDSGQTDAAERCLEHCLTIDPSFVNAQAYAEQALLLGDREQWIARLEEALNYPVLSLEHATVNVQLSNYFLTLDEPEKALPYAEAAATSGAAWTYTHLADVYSLLGRWEEAELLQRRVVQRYYRQSGVSWFWWCLKTGHGDFHAAAEVARQWYEKYSLTLITDLEKFPLVFYHRTAGEPKEALRVIKSIVEESRDPYFAWHAFILAESLDEPEYVDQLLEKIVAWEQSGRQEVYLSGSLRIAQMILKSRQDNRPGTISLQQLDREIATLKNDNPVTMWFVLGQYLAYHGREDDGIRYLERAAASPHTNQWDQWLATFYLSQFNHEPPPRRKDVQIPLEKTTSMGELDLYVHTSSPTRVDFLNDSDRIITSAQDGIVRVWRPGNPAPISEHDVGGYHLAISNDGQTISVLDEGGHGGAVWDLFSRKKVREYPKEGAYRAILGFIGNDPAQVIADDVLLQSTEIRNGHGRLSKYQNGSQEIEWVHRIGPYRPYLMTSDEDGKDLLLALGNHTSLTKFERLSAETGEVIEERIFPRTRLGRAGMSGDKQYLFTVSADGELTVRSVRNWEVIFRAITPGITTAVLSHDASLMAIGFRNGEVLLIDGRTGKSRAMSRAHLRDLLQIKFNRTGRLLVSIGDDFTARTWDVKKLLSSHQVQTVDVTNYRTVETNSLGMEMVPIPVSTFEMGASTRVSERPIHSVQLTNRILMARFEVTVRQFRNFVEDTGYKTDAEQSGKGGKHLPAPYSELLESPEYVWSSPGFEQSEDHPVVQVSWNDARAFCEWLSQKEKQTYRLPTEAEWEHACRGGSTTRWNYGEELDSYPTYANLRDVSLAQRYNLISSLEPKSDEQIYTAPVGSFLPNGFGLYDAHGNVREWCSDYYSTEYYAKSPPANPPGPTKGSTRVNRGGSYLERLDFMRCSHRGFDLPSTARSDLGFRVVCEQDK